MSQTLKDKRTIQVHSIILSQHSNVFRTMFFSEKTILSHSSITVIPLIDDDPMVIERFIESIYYLPQDSPETVLSLANAFDLFEISRKYEVPDCGQQCLKMIQYAAIYEHMIDSSDSVTCKILSRLNRYFEEELIVTLNEEHVSLDNEAAVSKILLRSKYDPHFSVLIVMLRAIESILTELDKFLVLFFPFFLFLLF